MLGLLPRPEVANWWPGGLIGSQACFGSFHSIFERLKLVSKLKKKKKTFHIKMWISDFC